MNSGGAGPAQACLLVVDDSATIRGLVRALLAERGFRVLEAQNGAEAARLYREHGREIDVVLLDEEMPLMGGHETMSALLALDPGVRAICMSGGLAAARTAGGGEFGFKGFVRKPFKLADLLVELERVLGPGFLDSPGPRC